MTSNGLAEYFEHDKNTYVSDDNSRLEFTSLSKCDIASWTNFDDPRSRYVTIMTIVFNGSNHSNLLFVDHAAKTMTVIEPFGDFNPLHVPGEIDSLPTDMQLFVQKHQNPKYTSESFHADHLTYLAVCYYVGKTIASPIGYEMDMRTLESMQMIHIMELSYIVHNQDLFEYLSGINGLCEMWSMINIVLMVRYPNQTIIDLQKSLINWLFERKSNMALIAPVFIRNILESLTNDRFAAITGVLARESNPTLLEIAQSFEVT